MSAADQVFAVSVADDGDVFGAVAVEVIFGIPGMGTLIYNAISARQIVELQSYIAIIAIGYVLLNFVIDSLYIVLDPRIRRA